MEATLTSDAGSISELFDRDPVEWSDADMDRMIAHWRKLRIEFKRDGKAAKTTAAAKAPKIAVDKATTADDLLGKLGL